VPSSLLLTRSAFLRTNPRRLYLAHIIVLNAVYGLLNGHLDNPILKVFTIAIVAFLGTYALISLIALLPKSKWIVG
jgi:surface polysaccharide O-acyltransferase-like enzyme